MYKHKEIEARAAQLSPVLRGLVQELIHRGELYAPLDVPLEEGLESDLEAQLRLVLSDPELKKEFVEFHQALADAYEEDAAAIARGEHDHEL